MATSLFAFLRATFYRRVPLWLEVCSDLAKVPQVLGVGDLHVENFGTWRDTEGRLVWGVNDFDEVARMPYAVDLTRLVTSAIVAKQENELTIDARVAAASVLEGYSESLDSGGNPFILEENHHALRTMALAAEREPNHFLVQAHQSSAVTPPKRVQRLLERSLPDRTEGIAFSRRIGGWVALAGQDTWLLLPAMGALSLARRKPGCPRLGAGPTDARGNIPTRFGCLNARCGSRTHIIRSRKIGSFVG
jgi:uncharacterized protein (DUF2252 family)